VIILLKLFLHVACKVACPIILGFEHLFENLSQGLIDVEDVIEASEFSSIFVAVAKIAVLLVEIPYKALNVSSLKSVGSFLDSEEEFLKLLLNMPVIIVSLETEAESCFPTQVHKKVRHRRINSEIF
jgi:hypothetical protein